jgi:para-aminobenzoate synthetase/4-amino-4-deoxychorismate lyase
LQALYPSGSVTGAPKIRTLEIIQALEDSPRQIYTGAIGFVSPGPEAVFNVAIRTLLVDTQTGVAELGVGSGITYDSSPEAEYQECLLKAQFLSQSRPEFSLLESILYDHSTGFSLLDRHFLRLADSAVYFGFRFDEREIRAALHRLAELLPAGRFKIRLVLHRDGRFRMTHESLADSDPHQLLKIALAAEPVDSREVFLFHKTTQRQAYEIRKVSRPDVDDVLLMNEKGELTESTMANLLVRLDGEDYTPPVACGLLAGTLRAELITQGKLSERVLRPEDLQQAQAIFLINSVRGWMAARVVE